jgi:hypothetical protein
MRWGRFEANTDINGLVDKVNREDIWRAAAKTVGAPAPASTSRGKETFFDGKVFDPANPAAYLASLANDRDHVVWLVGRRLRGGFLGRGGHQHARRLNLSPSVVAGGCRHGRIGKRRSGILPLVAALMASQQGTIATLRPARLDDRRPWHWSGADGMDAVAAGSKVVLRG